MDHNVAIVGGKAYKAVRETRKGGCDGCVFSPNKSTLCTKEHDRLFGESVHNCTKYRRDDYTAVIYKRHYSAHQVALSIRNNLQHAKNLQPIIDKLIDENQPKTALNFGGMDLMKPCKTPDPLPKLTRLQLQSLGKGMIGDEHTLHPHGEVVLKPAVKMEPVPKVLVMEPTILSSLLNGFL